MGRQMTNYWDKGVFEPNAKNLDRPNLLQGDVSLPAAVLQVPWLNNNIRWMQEFADQTHVKLAPHGKTTMCPEIFDRQMQSGAWGITLATAPQVAAAASHGIRRIILANQLIGRRNMEIIAGILDSVTFYSIVDSVENVAALGQFYAANHQELAVLIEIGTAQGRTGCRDINQALDLSAAITQTAGVRLAGIEVYEGILHGKDAESAVLQLLDRVISTTKELMALNAFATDEIILTGAGSAWYDLVVKRFLVDQLPSNVAPVIRPGAYVIHDAGICEQFQSTVLHRSNTANKMQGGLQSCLEIWAYVQSIPEDGLAIVAMGKRDVGFTDGLPSPSLHYRHTWHSPKTVATGWKVKNLMDQHTFMDIAKGDDIAVGDMVSFSISHPCLTCDKWRYFCAVDSDYKVLDSWPTFF